jgi:hypothetical protein
MLDAYLNNRFFKLWVFHYLDLSTSGFFKL